MFYLVLSLIIAIILLIFTLLLLVVIPILVYQKRFNSLVDFWKQRWEAENHLLVKTSKELNQIKYANNSKSSS